MYSYLHSSHDSHLPDDPVLINDKDATDPKATECPWQAPTYPAVLGDMMHPLEDHSA